MTAADNSQRYSGGRAVRQRSSSSIAGWRQHCQCQYVHICTYTPHSFSSVMAHKRLYVRIHNICYYSYRFATYIGHRTSDYMYLPVGRS